MKHFNTAGPCIAGDHYMLPPERRLPEACELIEQKKYFVLHAPRQTGKTTALATLARRLTAEGDRVALWLSCEVAEAAGDDYAAAEEMLLGQIRDAAANSGLSPELLPPVPWPTAEPGRRLLGGLTAWAEQCPLPVALFFDEIDALRGESLRSVLRQLRSGYTTRPAPFPASVVLCGLRDVRDYKAAAGGDTTRLGSASPFNIKVKSLRLGDFSADEVGELYGQHTEETGQEFTAEALDRAFCYTQGQPWLVNALAYEVIQEMKIRVTITGDHMDEAKERLIRARATHLDSLAARLAEPRVKRIIEPMIAGTLPSNAGGTFDDDVGYLRDLGLVGQGKPVAVANPIYREVIVRVLGSMYEDIIAADHRAYVRADGQLDLQTLLREFAPWWKENGEILINNGTYHETACELVLMAYLTRLVNGGGYIQREYAIGKGRIDLLILWPYTDPEGVHRTQREAIELKVWRGGGDPLDAGLRQLDEYLDRLELDDGVLIVFDHRQDAAPVAERTAFAEATSPSGRPITVLRA